MLRDAPDRKPVDRWMDTLIPKVTQLQQSLKQIEPKQIAENSGATLDNDSLYLKMLLHPFAIDVTDFIVCDSTGEPVSPFIQSLILTYLHTADGTPPANQWISFRELPNGGFYHQAFQGYAANRFTKQWGDNLDEFVGACQAIGGTSFDLGDAAFAFKVLPHLHIAAVYWLGDEDFPSQASILFDAAASHYMITDGLAVLGSRLAGNILAA